MSESAARTRATAVITVHKYEPSAYDEPADGTYLCTVMTAFARVRPALSPMSLTSGFLASSARSGRAGHPATAPGGR